MIHLLETDATFQVLFLVISTINIVGATLAFSVPFIVAGIYKKAYRKYAEEAYRDTLNQLLAEGVHLKPHNVIEKFFNAHQTTMEDEGVAMYNRWARLVDPATFIARLANRHRLAISRDIYARYRKLLDEQHRTGKIHVVYV